MVTFETTGAKKETGGVILHNWWKQILHIN
jgi:hypothetical protein